MARKVRVEGRVGDETEGDGSTDIVLGGFRGRWTLQDREPGQWTDELLTGIRGRWGSAGRGRDGRWVHDGNERWGGGGWLRMMRASQGCEDEDGVRRRSQ